ncbi:MAG: hypothetical protein HQM04_15085 [Magnetococcales bacterium]|nr:hypothetical protein [Magnetococcales bacterium]MBF0116350.1 hypothetical protein [Magnetococcales bacterium]
MERVVEPERKTVVLLVDNVRRDLPGSVLLAYLLDQRGIRCHLEPLESYKAVLAACRPGMIVFNHLVASHLVNYSNRLAQMNVLTAVLPNEMTYSEDAMVFLAGRYHKNAHIDVQFCWNEKFRQAIRDEGFQSRLEVVGMPRFDFYFEPWSAVFALPPQKKRPVVLFVFNFVLARWYEMGHDAAYKRFKDWSDKSDFSASYWENICLNHANRQRAMQFLEALVKSDRYHVILRPHPLEDRQFYYQWMADLSEQQKEHVEINADSNIGELILRSDVSVVCEMCTTVLENWLAKRPLVQLAFDRSTPFYNQHTVHLNVECDQPDQLPDIIAQQLTTAEANELIERRKEHLEEWCATPTGDSTLRVAKVIEEMLSNKPLTDWRKLVFKDYLRAVKWHALAALGLPFNWSPLLKIKSFLSNKYAMKVITQQKSITPQHVRKLRKLFDERLGKKSA